MGGAATNQNGTIDFDPKPYLGSALKTQTPKGRSPLGARCGAVINLHLGPKEDAVLSESESEDPARLASKERSMGFLEKWGITHRCLTN